MSKACQAFGLHRVDHLDFAVLLQQVLQHGEVINDQGDHGDSALDITQRPHVCRVDKEIGRRASSGHVGEIPEDPPYLRTSHVPSQVLEGGLGERLHEVKFAVVVVILTPGIGQELQRDALDGDIRLDFLIEFD